MKDIFYQRCRLQTRLPAKHLYVPSHFWLEKQPQDGPWRVGFTKFATRMLGDIVEFAFSVKAGTRVEQGAEIGWIEGFKAVSALYTVSAGVFLGANPALQEEIDIVDRLPYTQGWLYQVEGDPAPDCMDVHEYVAYLDATIDTLLGKSKEEDDCN